MGDKNRKVNRCRWHRFFFQKIQKKGKNPSSTGFFPLKQVITSLKTMIMKEIHTIETHVSEIRTLLAEPNWMRIVPAEKLKDAHDSFTQIRNVLLDCVFHSGDVLEALQWQIDHTEDDSGAMPHRTINKNGVRYSTEDLLKMRLKTLTLICEPAVADDIIKYVMLYADDLKQQIAEMKVSNALKSASGRNR